VRVLHINKFLFRRGGAERYLFDVAAELTRRGHECSFFGTAHADNVPLALNRYYPPYRDFAAARPAPGDALAAVWSRAAARKLEGFLAHFQPDVAHVHNIAYHLTPAILPALSRAGVAAVMTLHDYNLFCPNHYFYSRDVPCFRCPDGRYFSCVTRRCVKGRLGPSLVGYAAHLVARRTGVYRRLGRLLVFSDFMRGFAVRAGFVPDRITLLPPAVNVSARRAGRKRNYFLYAGRLAPEKGVDELIFAAGLAEATVAVRVAGDGPERESLTRLAADYAPGRVAFLGPLDDQALAAEMAAARAVVVPSRWPENTPAVILEAFAAGTAVVAARGGGVPELVTDGREGLLYEPGDVAALTTLLKRLAGPAQLARELGRRARARAARDFDFRAHVDRLEAIYREVAA